LTDTEIHRALLNSDNKIEDIIWDGVEVDWPAWFKKIAENQEIVKKINRQYQRVYRQRVKIVSPLFMRKKYGLIHVIIWSLFVGKCLAHRQFVSNVDET